MKIGQEKILTYCGTRLMHKVIKCSNCDTLIWKPLNKIKKHKNWFCSSECQYEFSKNQTTVKCAYCNELFQRQTSKLKNSKSGLYFCCREHKDLAQRIDSHVPFYIKGYNKGNSTYSNRAKEHYQIKCEYCGFDEYPEILEVHHIDRNKENNNIENLTILCPNCHSMDTRKLGKYERAATRLMFKLKGE